VRGGAIDEGSIERACPGGSTEHEGGTPAGAAQEDLRRQAGKPKLVWSAIVPDAAKLAPVLAFLKERA